MRSCTETSFLSGDTTLLLRIPTEVSSFDVKKRVLFHVCIFQLAKYQFVKFQLPLSSGLGIWLGLSDLVD